ncbi:MAG: HAD-IA family hydrolase [Planctomycetota bacterium]
MPAPDTGNPSPDIRLIVFDLGRVLLRIVDDFDHACRRANLPPIPGFSGDLSIHALRNTDPDAAELFNGFEIGTVTIEDYAARAAAITGSPAEHIMAILDAAIIETYPGATDLLEQLHALPVKTACLSNTNARHWQLISDPDNPSYIPLHLLDFPLGSQLVGHAKPHPAIYQHLGTLSQTPPQHILFFDDLPENIAAAKACGWHAELVSRDTDNPVPALRRSLEAYRVLSHTP